MVFAAWEVRAAEEVGALAMLDDEESGFAVGARLNVIRLGVLGHLLGFVRIVVEVAGITAGREARTADEAFALAVFSAAASTGRRVRIIDRLNQPADHAVNIYHPEGEYLKGLLLYVE